MQRDALRPLHFSEQTRRAGKSILSGEKLFFFPYFSFGLKEKMVVPNGAKLYSQRIFHL